jgi:hypothetical protein
MIEEIEWILSHSRRTSGVFSKLLGRPVDETFSMVVQ